MTESLPPDHGGKPPQDVLHPRTIRSFVRRAGRIRLGHGVWDLVFRKH